MKTEPEYVTLARIANCYENYACSDANLVGFHAMTVRRELEAAQKALDFLKDTFGESEKQSRITTIARLCNLAPDDDGEAFMPMTDSELEAMHTRMAA